jgi:UPF0755 protein
VTVRGPASALIGILLALLAAGAVLLVVRSPAAVAQRGVRIDAAVTDADPLLTAVESGDTAATIGARLAEAGVLADAKSFQLLASLTGSERNLVAGEYEFALATSPLDALVRIRDGLTAANVVTVREGLRIEEVAELLERRRVVAATDFLAAAQSLAQGESRPAVLADLPPGASLEGYLYPATYSFSKRATAAEVAAEMVGVLDERFEPALRAEAALLGLSVHDVLTLASIVEREAVLPTERPLIASVYLNRLIQGMPLQADPTVQYAVATPASVSQFGYWKRELSADDLLAPSAYNTYQNGGLPPGPIATPGLDSIIAVIRPASTTYVFFVARPDGSHAFATTFDEHTANVARYQR